MFPLAATCSSPEHRCATVDRRAIHRSRMMALVSVAIVLAAGCAAPASSVNPTERPEGQTALQRKRLTAAIFGLGFTYSTLLAVGGTGNAVPGT